MESIWGICENFSFVKVSYEYVMRCAIWYQSLFGVCLADQMQANLCAFFYLHVVSIRFDELACHSNGSIKCQTIECQSNGKTLAI